MGKRLKGDARDLMRAKIEPLYRAGATWGMIADRYGLTRAQVKHLFREIRECAPACEGHDQGAGTAEKPVLSHESAAGASAPFVSADERRDMLRAWLGTSYRPTPFMFQPHRTERTVIGVGDLHGRPDPAILAELVARSADVYIIGGDTTDSAFASAHPSDSRQDAARDPQVQARQEFANLRAWFETLLDGTKGAIKVARGNHDLWTWRQISALLPDWARTYYRDPLEMLVSDLGPRVSLVQQEATYTFPGGTTDDDIPANEFVFIEGDVLFSHINKTSSKTQPGVIKVYRDWFIPWARVLGMGHVRVIVHFHVHQRTLLNEEGGHMTLIEPGMGGLPSAETYKFGYQAKWRPSVQGFVQMTQYLDGQQWRTDLDSIELVAPRQARKAAA